MYILFFDFFVPRSICCLVFVFPIISGRWIESLIVVLDLKATGLCRSSVIWRLLRRYIVLAIGLGLGVSVG